MATCKKIKRVIERVCIGSLNKKISLHTRTIQVPKGGGVDFDEEFVLFESVWAMIQTTAGKVFFDGSNTDQAITHNFYIRYIPGVNITSEDWIIYNDKRYDIINIEVLDEIDRFIMLRANERGSIDYEVNKA